MTELETIIDAMEIAERTLLECKARIEELEKENETLKRDGAMITLQEKGLGVKMVTCQFCKAEYKNSNIERMQYHSLGICVPIQQSNL